ncbi:MAG: signal peptidase I [bacterium]|nr:signal peptidase I [bacterium]
MEPPILNPEEPPAPPPAAGLPAIYPVADVESPPPRRRRLRLFAGLFILLILVGANLAIALGKVEIDRVVSESMEPTLQIGDVILSDANAVPARYAIIVLNQPDAPQEKLVKRILGMPGDRLVIRDGILYVNGREEYSRQVADNVLQVPDLKVDVPENEYFVLGDNRNNSYDSINFSTVPLENIRGVVKCILWPWSRRGGFAPFQE